MNKSIRLADGRQLAYTDSGSDNGDVLFVFHGTPGSRLEHGDLSEHQNTKARLIIIDRPGYGRSDFCEQRTLLDWPGDVVQLADALELDRFAALGFSGGGPYAAVCASQIPERLTHVALVSALAPFDVPGITDEMIPTTRQLYELAAQDYQQAERQISQIVDSAEALFRVMEESTSQADRKIFSDKQFRSMYQQNIEESCRHGFKALAKDMSIAAQPWGFDPASINIPVTLWHGTADQNVPMTMGQYLSQTIPTCQVRFKSDEGHYLLFKYWYEILEELTSH